jgi:hypothetical protein
VGEFIFGSSLLIYSNLTNKNYNAVLTWFYLLSFNFSFIRINGYCKKDRLDSESRLKNRSAVTGNRIDKLFRPQ